VEKSVPYSLISFQLENVIGTNYLNLKLF